MQIEISNPRYIQLMIAKSNKANNIKDEMLQIHYLKHRVKNDAFNKANQVSSNIGILNISNKHAKLIQKMIDKKVCELIKQDMCKIMDAENIFYVVKE